MADANLLKSPDDPKAAKAKLKADRKEYKKTLKEQRKFQKEKEREFADRTAEINGDNAGGLATLVITFLIILIWLAIMVLLVKLDVGGFGSDILAPIIKDVPYLNLILPEGSAKGNDGQSDTDAADLTGVTADGTPVQEAQTLEDAQEYNKKLEQMLNNALLENADLKTENERLTTEVARLEPFEKQQKDFYEQKQKFYEEVVMGDNSPDPSNFRQYYEEIDPESAAELYKQVVQSDVEDAAIKSYATTYSGMKPKSAAKIFDEMVNENQITLVSKILAKMSVENRADILAAMQEGNAAKLTQLLEPTAMEQESTKINN